MRTSSRLGCLTGTGIIAVVITALVIAGYAYAKGGLLYNPGPLNAQSGEMLGGVRSHAEIAGDCKACHTAPWESAKMAARLLAASTGGKPVLLDIDYEAGHGIGSTKEQLFREYADIFSFIFWQTGTPGFAPR